MKLWSAASKVPKCSLPLSSSNGTELICPVMEQALPVPLWPLTLFQEDGDLAELWFAARVARDALWLFWIAQKLLGVTEKAGESKLCLYSKQRIVQMKGYISEDFPRIWRKGESSYWSD